MIKIELLRRGSSLFVFHLRFNSQNIKILKLKHFEESYTWRVSFAPRNAMFRNWVIKDFHQFRFVLKFKISSSCNSVARKAVHFLYFKSKGLIQYYRKIWVAFLWPLNPQSVQSFYPHTHTYSDAMFFGVADLFRQIANRIQLTRKNKLWNSSQGIKSEYWGLVPDVQGQHCKPEPSFATDIPLLQVRPSRPLRSSNVTLLRPHKDLSRKRLNSHERETWNAARTFWHPGIIF